ncbi:MAG: pectinesterase family protein [Bacteroidales bacterium]|nr:pectinesterase family protein [Bacteroidales bacterium]MCM1146975.1 pectinesterase family protein [Bacteroidales bacterium]MCM1205892.1 pectinesterase family protein [Bacillota bacterium]MCM1509867.1 pectinesterase family protein [Clostridium sp.]
MRKRLFGFLVLAMCAGVLAWATAEQPKRAAAEAAEPSVENATLSWTNGNESKASVTEGFEDKVLSTSVSVGSDLTVSGPTTYDIPDATVPLMTYLPTTSNPGCVPGDMIEYKVKLKKGLTFTPSSVEFDAVKEGTDGAYFSWSYTVDGVEGKIVAYDNPKEQIRRNNNANPSAPVTHKETITAEGGREFSLRFYISNVANNKKMSIGNIKINGTVSGTEEVRAFKDFALNMTTAPYTVTKPADGILPEGVTVSGTWHDSQHGYNTTTVTVPVDGPVRISLGRCQYGTPTATIKNGEEVLATVDCGGGCDGNAEWVYNSEEPATLTIVSASYVPYIAVEACELLPMVDVQYYDTDGKLLGTETVQGGSALAYKYGEADVTVPEGEAFRGWFASEQQTALKVAEGTVIQENIKLYARATQIEVPTSTSRFIYDLTKPYFYIEDHEAIEIEGKYYNTHGWLVDKGGSIKVKVAGKAYVTVGDCLYSAESTATVTDESGNTVAEFPVKGEADGAEQTFSYDGEAGWLTITFPAGAYVHSVAVWNVVDFVEYDETSGYYEIASGDVSSFLIALKSASSREETKIFLHDGLYDLGTTVLTNVSGKNISIIGESREGTVIQNAPAKENEGIGVTATLYNTSSDLYIQDLTIRNAMTFNGGTGRAVTLQDKGNRTICKNVSLESYQDTYYSNNNSACFYFEDGEIHGVVDYVCGGGDVYYNRVKFVNEQIKATTIAAPNGAKKYGYVMNDCTIETLCSNFNYGRAWGSYSGLAWINTTINQPSKLVSTRFTVAGVNCAADRFVEYNTKDANGNVISPASNIIEFTHSTGNKKYETILTAEEAAEYAIDKVFPDWRAEEIAAQKIMGAVSITDNVLTWNAVDGSGAYAVLKNGKVVAVIAGTSYTVDDTEATWAVRAANGRGGFGVAAVATSGTGISNVEVDSASNANAVGKLVENGRVVIVKDGNKFSASGQVIE